METTVYNKAPLAMWMCVRPPENGASRHASGGILRFLNPLKPTVNRVAFSQP